MAAVGTHLPDRSSKSTGGMSRLSMMQAKVREQLMIEKESRLLEMAARQEAEREDIINRVTKTSASSLSSSMSSLNSSGAGQGRVRKMFEERRNNPRGYQQSPKGYDKSYPLDPVKKDMVASRPPAMRGGRAGRGVSVDRAPPQQDDMIMGRSRSQAPIQRANRGDNRIQKPPKAPPGGRSLFHHKSTSSLMDGREIHYNGNSRGPSPVPPSSTKSSPGPRGGPVTPIRRPPPNNQRKPPPPKSRSENNFLAVNGNNNFENRSRSPTPTPKHSDNRNEEVKGGFLSKLGFKSKADKSPSPATKAPAASKQLLSVNNRRTGGASSPSPRRAKSPVPANLRQCKYCERNFAPDRIEKHEIICQKSKAKAKKRKAFDPVKMRTTGTEAEKFVARGAHLKENPKIKAKKNNWRKKHEDFIKTVRAAKGMKGYEAPPLDTSDYVECPYCGRKFSEGVADRHIPKCKDITSNKPNRGAGPPKAPPRRR